MKKKRTIFKVLLTVILVSSSLLLLGIFGIYAYAKSNIDFSVDESLFESAKGSSITRLYYDENPYDNVYTPTELTKIEPSQNKKSWYSYGEISDNIKKAFIVVEDQKFFTHSGVDVKRTAFAFLNYFFKFRDRFGASTITQQVIKNISGDNEQTLSRKLQEIIRAVNIEKTHTKEEIFEVYLNIVPMGEGILGVGFASEYYFGKTPDSLTYAEAATLVGITNAPTKYNPIKNKEACLTKRNSVLSVLLNNHIISDAEYEEAVSSDLNIIAESDGDFRVNSWFVETVLDDVTRDLAKKMNISESTARLMIMNGGYSIYTTENPKIQDKLEEYFENPDNFPSDINRGLNYSMVILDSKSGDLVGIVGAVNKKTGNRLLNHALVPHTPGSTLKPIALYAEAINQKKVSWATVFDDCPVTFTEKENGVYTYFPKNSPEIYEGFISLADALRLSKNTVAVRLYNLLGKENIFNRLKYDFGFDTLVEKEALAGGGIITDKAASPLALGQLSYGVSLRSLCEAYTVFTNEGRLQNARSYIAVYNEKGELVLNNQKREKEIYSNETIEIMNQMLAGVVEDGTARAITLDEILDTAGKTGTSGGDRDRLFIGYTPYYTAGVWCGFEKSGEAIGTQSISHLKIWDDVMKEIHELMLGNLENPESFSTESLEWLPYCKDSGKLYYDTCMEDERGVRLEYGYFSPDNKPKSVCDRHVLCEIDRETGLLADENTPRENIEIISLLKGELRELPIDISILDESYFVESKRNTDDELQADIYEKTEYRSIYKGWGTDCPCALWSKRRDYRRVSSKA